MSINCQLFFNPLPKSHLVEYSGQDVDLHLSHDYENDRELIFSNYKCELGVYKLIDRFSDRICKNYLNAFRDVEPHIDFGIPPMFVYDMQSIVGYVQPNGVLELVNNQFNNYGSKVLELIVKEFSHGSA